MKKRAKAREVEREAAGGGDIFLMRTPDDVSGQVSVWIGMCQCKIFRD